MTKIALSPVYSIHIPGDYYSVEPLLDQYDDYQKLGAFSTLKIK